MHRISQLGFAWVWLILICWLVAGWINGLGVSFQWLAWIPDTAWLLIALPGAMLVEFDWRNVGSKSKWWKAIVLIPIGMLLATSMFNDWRFQRPLTEDGVRIAFLNASDPSPRRVDDIVAKIFELEAELVVVSNPGALRAGIDRVVSGDEGWNFFSSYRFLILSRYPITTFRMKFAADEILGSMIQVELPERGPFKVLGVDLPSNPKIDRMEVAVRLREFMATTDSESFDLLVGDLNMTPRSVALDIVAGEARNAFNVAGAGWGGTWTSDRPILRVDHGLVREGIEVLDARTFDVGVRHRGLLITLGDVEPSTESDGIE